MSVGATIHPLPPLPHPGRRRFRRGRVALLVLVALGLVAALVVQRVRKGGGETIDTALVATAKRGKLEVNVLETGRIEPRAQSQVKSRVGGQVTAVTVQEGERVKVGQILVRLEPTDYRREVARMQAEVEQQRLATEYTTVQLQRAEKAMANAIAPAAELDLARHEAALAKARWEVGKVALETAKDRLRYTQIEAPIAGTVTQRNINPGEVVIPGVTATFDGKPLLVIADLSTLLVKIELNQIDVAKVRLGQIADISVDALPGKVWKAKITKVAPSAVAAGGGRSSGQQGGSTLDVFPVEAELLGVAGLGEIKPGMTADVRVLVETHEDVTTLPIEAVVTEKGASFVNLVEEVGGKARTKRRDVKLGPRNDREVVLAEGIRPGDRVLIKPPAANEVKY